MQSDGNLDLFYDIRHESCLQNWIVFSKLYCLHSQTSKNLRFFMSSSKIIEVITVKPIGDCIFLCSLQVQCLEIILFQYLIWELKIIAIKYFVQEESLIAYCSSYSFLCSLQVFGNNFILIFY